MHRPFQLWIYNDISVEHLQNTKPDLGSKEVIPQPDMQGLEIRYAAGILRANENLRTVHLPGDGQRQLLTL